MNKVCFCFPFPFFPFELLTAGGTSSPPTSCSTGVLLPLPFPPAFHAGGGGVPPVPNIFFKLVLPLICGFARYGAPLGNPGKEASFNLGGGALVAVVVLEDEPGTERIATVGGAPFALADNGVLCCVCRKAGAVDAAESAGNRDVLDEDDAEDEGIAGNEDDAARATRSRTCRDDC